VVVAPETSKDDLERRVREMLQACERRPGRKMAGVAEAGGSTRTRGVDCVCRESASRMGQPQDAEHGRTAIHHCSCGILGLAMTTAPVRADRESIAPSQ